MLHTPIEYKTYGCKFKCGYEHKKDIKKVEKHEAICWYNPVNKTCLTCKYGRIEHDSCLHTELDGWPEERWKYRVCELDADMLFEKHSNDPVKPKINCENWKLREA